MFRRNGGGGGIGPRDIFRFGLDLLGGFERSSFIRESFVEPILFQRTRTFAPTPATPPPAPLQAVDAGRTLSPPEPRIVSAATSDSPEAAGIGFFDDLVDVFQDAAVGVGRTAARLLVPDPIESAIQILFPDVGSQVFGSPLGLPSPAIIPPSFPAVISEAGATPPFFPGPVGTIGRIEDLFPQSTVDMLRLPGSEVFVEAPAAVNDPDFGVVRDEPGIFDDLGRAAVDIIPELIPEVFGGGIGGEIAGGLSSVFLENVLPTPGQLPDADVFEDPFMNPPLEAAPTARPTMAEMTIEQWAAAGRPSGFCLTTRGTVTRRRRRRKRPLSQQAKDDLAWAKATFGAGKQFDAVVSRMRF